MKQLGADYNNYTKKSGSNRANRSLRGFGVDDNFFGGRRNNVFGEQRRG